MCYVCTKYNERKLCKNFYPSGVSAVTAAVHFRLIPSTLNSDLRSYAQGHKLMEAEVGVPLTSIDRDNFDDDLLHKVAGNPLHVFKFMLRATKDLNLIVKELSTRIKGKMFTQLHGLKCELHKI